MKSHLIALAAMFVLCAACADETSTDAPATTDDTGGGAADTADTGTADTAAPDVGTEDAAPSDAGPAADTDMVEDTRVDTRPDPECLANWVVYIAGDVQEQDGSPIAGAKAQVCVRIGERDGRLVCLAPNDTDAEGHFEITVPVNTRCMGYGSMRVILPSANRATSYCHVEPREGDVTLSLDEPITLFETTPAEVLPPYGDPSMARTVAFEGGLEVEVVPDQLGFTFDEAKYNRLAGAQVDPSDPSLCFLTEPVDGLWAFSPEVNATAPFVFRFPNAQGYDAGAAVDLFVLGGLDTTLPDGSSITETEWLRYGTALVSADGTIIEGNSRTNGLPALNWLGYRLAE